MRHIRTPLPRWTRLALATAATATFALPVHADGNKAAASVTRDQAATRASSTQGASGQQLKEYRAVRASELIGRNVRNAQDKDIGKIEDMVVDMSTGKVRYAILAFDPGILEAEKLFAVPAAELRPSGDGKQFVYDIRRDRLEQAKVDRKDWDTVFSRPDYVASLDRTYGITQPGPGARAHRVSDLLDKEVHGRGGEDIGNIEELVIDMGNQRVHYAVVAFDAGAAQAEKEYVLPLSAFRPGPQRDRLVLDLAQSKLHGMRGFAEDRYASLNDPVWVRDIDRYLAAIEPEGKTSASGTSAAAGTAGAAPRQSASSPSQKASAQQATSEQQLKTYRALRASQLIGKAVRNPQGKDIGKIEDMVVDMNSGKVRYAVLAFDPGIFEAEKLFAVPTTELRLSGDRDDIVYDIRREQLERVKVDRKDWYSALFSPDYIATVDKTYGITQPGTNARAHRVSDLLGKDVHDRAGKDIGDVEELVVDMGSQRVHYAVLAFDPGWTKPESNYAFPLKAFSLGDDGKKLVLDVDKSKVQAMRSFGDDRYGDLNDRTWVVDVDRYLVAVIPLPDAPSGSSRADAASTRDKPNTSSSGTSSGGTSSGSSSSGSSGSKGGGGY